MPLKVFPSVSKNHEIMTPKLITLLPKRALLSCIPGEEASDEACRDVLHVDCNLAEPEDDNRKHRIPGRES